ncbi:MAG: FkbM family methyltransferase [bacterium]|nr:FkbM family methyltransferase [bacterium]
MFWLRLIKLGQIISDPFLVSALMKGVAAGTEHRLVLQGFNFDFIVDVGANRGQFALISRKVFPRAKIHSFEPLEEPAHIFKRIFSNDPNVTLHACALGREKKTAAIHVTKDDDSSSMLPIMETQSNMFPGATEKETRQVTVLPLSQALGDISIPPASLLKIDVQGFELDVLQGCEDILDKFSYLYIECSFIELYEGQALAHQIIAWLEQRNFILSGIHNLYYKKNGRAIQGDFLFSQKNN